MRKACIFLGALANVILFFNGCSKENTKMTITKDSFGSTSEGVAVDLYTLTSAGGIEVKMTNYGGIITSLKTPDRDGNLDDIVLGYDTLAEYIEGSPYFGALIGRYGNRIAKGKFTLDGVEYTLAKNNLGNHLHGGIIGFDKIVWTAEQIKDDTGASLKLKYLSKDGEEGYPGNLDCTVIYTLTSDGRLKISYEAQTDKPTVINLTSHSYFNLAGHASGDILDHELMLNANRYTPVDTTLIPTGQIAPVKGTPLDFTTPTPIGERIAQIEGGYDHNFVLNSSDGSPALAARVYEPKTGRVMEISTTEPGIQFYSGNFLDGSNKGKGATYNKHNGFCLETQHFPDSPNKPDFPSVVLRPEEKYTQLTVHEFSVK
jgi:aldose 1-epimerase